MKSVPPVTVDASARVAKGSKQVIGGLCAAMFTDGRLDAARQVISRPGVCQHCLVPAPRRLDYISREDGWKACRMPRMLASPKMYAAASLNGLPDVLLTRFIAWHATFTMRSNSCAIVQKCSAGSCRETQSRHASSSLRRYREGIRRKSLLSGSNWIAANFVGVDAGVGVGINSYRCVWALP